MSLCPRSSVGMSIRMVSGRSTVQSRSRARVVLLLVRGRAPGIMLFLKVAFSLISTGLKGHWRTDHHRKGCEHAGG
jgi:hypothetical protein